VSFSGSGISLDLFLTSLGGSLGCEFLLLELSLSSSDLGSKLVLLGLFFGKFLGRLSVLGLIDSLLEGDSLIGFGGFLNLSSLGFLLFSNNFSGGLNWGNWIEEKGFDGLGSNGSINWGSGNWGSDNWEDLGDWSSGDWGSGNWGSSSWSWWGSKSDGINL